NRSFGPILSANGGTLLVPSAASDLVAHDFNQASDLFALSKSLYVWVVARGPGQGATLAWFARPGENYQVQYKTALSDPEWREVAGPGMINGATAEFTDPSPPSNQRFYRVTAF